MHSGQGMGFTSLPRLLRAGGTGRLFFCHPLCPVVGPFAGSRSLPRLCLPPLFLFLLLPLFLLLLLLLMPLLPLLLMLLLLLLLMHLLPLLPLLLSSLVRGS